MTTPTWFVATVVMWGLLPVVTPLLAIYDVVLRRQFSATRTWVFFALFFAIESGGLIGAAWLWLKRLLTDMPTEEWWDVNRRLQRWWGRSLFWCAVRVFDVDVTVEGLEALEDRHPALVLSRHVSTLDTMIPLAVVAGQKSYRYVIKAELLIDPAMDYVAQRFPNCFVRRGSSNHDDELQKVLRLGRDLQQGGAVVIYPEGTRFSVAKRERLLEKFSVADPDDLLGVVQRLRRTLPPLRDGAKQLVEKTEGTDVVFIAHRGVDEAGAMSDLVRGRLTGAHLEVRMWRVASADVPRDPAGVRDFMLRNWELVDAFATGEEIETEATDGAGTRSVRRLRNVG